MLFSIKGKQTAEIHTFRSVIGDMQDEFLLFYSKAKTMGCIKMIHESH